MRKAHRLHAIYILGRRWPIRFKRMAKDYGHCETPPPKITIDSGQSKEQQRDSLTHEITHAIDFDISLGLKEEQVGRLATAWLNTLRNNPELVAFLLAE